VRYLITATDEQGRSYLASDVDLSAPLGELARMERHELYRGPAVPPRQPVQSVGKDLDAGPPVGEATWKVIECPPGWGYEAHFSWSVDFSAVAEGSVEFGTDTETVVLNAGDAVLVNGASHTWRTEHGCRLLVAMLGAERD
jgi:hypothetical protein